jgi:hypothetical protein
MICEVFRNRRLPPAVNWALSMYLVLKGNPLINMLDRGYRERSPRPTNSEGSFRPAIPDLCRGLISRDSAGILIFSGRLIFTGCFREV